MAGQKQPIELVIAKGNKHLTKAEIAERRASEIKPISDNIEPPVYLSAKQKKDFIKYAEQLQDLKIMGETDIDALARYVISLDMYTKVCKKLNRADIMEDPIKFNAFLRNQDLLFKQCRSSASDLGMTISSRCKLVVPQPPEEKPANKFDQFEKNSNG